MGRARSVLLSCTGGRGPIPRWIVSVVAVAGALAACGGGDDADGGADGPAPWSEVASVAARAASGLAELDGALLIGELTTGRIVRWDPETGTTSAVTTVEVATGGQRGLLGLGVDPDGSVLLSRTRPDGRLVVERLGDGNEPELVWAGPTSTDRATGGRFVVTPDGRIVVGVGDLLDPEAVDDPAAPNGKLLAVGGAEPEVVAGGWNNPFALDVASDGTIWVADNAPGGRAPERMARVAPSGTVEVVAETTPQRAPSGLAVLDDGRLAVCGFLSGQLVVDGAVVADDCAYGVVALDGGSLAYAAADRVVVLAPHRGPSPPRLGEPSSAARTWSRDRS